MRTGLPKQKKITDIWFDEKDPLIHIRTHNTDLKKRLAAYAEQHPDVCRQTDADPETGCMKCVPRSPAASRVHANSISAVSSPQTKEDASSFPSVFSGFKI